jgi:hypothetical protein
VDLKGTDVKFVTRIEDATKLDPVAFDEGRQEIYIVGVVFSSKGELLFRSATVILQKLNSRLPNDTVAQNHQCWLQPASLASLGAHPWDCLIENK